jgi:hypothetical protein
VDGWQRTVQKSVRGPIEASASVMKELFQVKFRVISQAKRDDGSSTVMVVWTVERTQRRRWARLILGSRWRRVLSVVVARLDPRSGPMGLSQFEGAMCKEETHAQRNKLSRQANQKIQPEPAVWLAQNAVGAGPLFVFIFQ